jgi:glycosyltransferase involved in cell wall biosynthesis
LAIVASKIGGFLDLVDNEKNGFLIDVRDIPAFSRALRELISNPESLLRFREASLKKAGGFDIEKIADQYQAILQGVLNEN